MVFNVKAYQKDYHKAWHQANKEAQSTRNKAYYKANKERIAARSKAHREANKESLAAQSKEWHEANKKHCSEKSRRNYLKRKYKLTPDAYNAMLESQCNRCACCKTPFGLLKAHNPHVDHCHATGCVRGILCYTCNLTLGLAADSPKLLLALADYLESCDDFQR